MGGGAWPFLVGGVICLVNSVNERDLNLLNSSRNIANYKHLVRVLGEGEGRGLALFLFSLLLSLGVSFIPGKENSRFFNFLEGLFVSSEWKFEAITGL